MMLRLDYLGEVQAVVPLECPESLNVVTEAAVWMWEFHPPNRDGLAVASNHNVTIGYHNNAVVMENENDRSDYAMAYAAPVLIPRWRDIDGNRGIQKALREEGELHARCVMEWKVDDFLQPYDVEVIDCPAMLAEEVERLGRWSGFELVGAVAGDGNVYRMDTTFHQPLENPRRSSKVAKR